MEFEAFGKSLLVLEDKGGSEVGGIKIASVGKLKSGVVLSVGEKVVWESELLDVGDLVVYLSEKSMPFEFGNPNVVVVNVDDVVALKPGDKVDFE